MKTVLAVDCCIRGSESRTKLLLDAYLKALSEDCRVEYLKLDEENLSPLVGDYFQQRQELLDAGELDHPRFRYAHAFAEADSIVVAAPFWDLSFPALLKIYIEQISVDGITFKSVHGGLQGLCRADRLVFLTTRGGCYEGSLDESGSRYLEALCRFFGIDDYFYVAADGLDMSSTDFDKVMSDAINKAAALASDIR